VFPQELVQIDRQLLEALNLGGSQRSLVTI
jgi:hypothetical protein